MSSDMRIRARKIIVFTVAAALAVASGFAPRHAQARTHSHATHAVPSKPHHHEAGQAAHHHNADDMAKAAAQALCHNDGQGTQQPNSPLHNCCVASCSAVAFIFASFSFDIPLPNSDYGVLPPAQLTPALLTTADPPPR
jgi:hypothetical protein